MARFVASVRRSRRAFRNGSGAKVKHHGHDLARTAKDARTIGRSRGGGFSSTSVVGQHVASGASDSAKSFDQRR